jgi:hypothetical protein
MKWRIEIIWLSNKAKTFDKIFNCKLIDIVGVQGMRLMCRSQINPESSVILTRIK